MNMYDNKKVYEQYPNTDNYDNKVYTHIITTRISTAIKNTLILSQHEKTMKIKGTRTFVRHEYLRQLKVHGYYQNENTYDNKCVHEHY